MSDNFDTPIYVCGALRSPKQMLAQQEYGGHLSLHDDQMANQLGFRAGAIEGPTHFSQFEPLLAEVWGKEWFETGCLSAHYRNMVVEGEQVRAYVERPRKAQNLVRIRAEKADGTEVLVGSASIGGDPPQSELESRLSGLRLPGPLVILRDLDVGMRGAEVEEVRMDFDQHMGKMYPFSLNQKLEFITELSPWFTEKGGPSSPWGRAIIPLEMISVLASYSGRGAGFPSHGPAVGLIAGQQIRRVRGPLFVGEDYLVDREIIALSESRRTESTWTRVSIREPGSNDLVAEMIMNGATLKDSYPNYQQELAALTQ